MRQNTLGGNGMDKKLKLRELARQAKRKRDERKEAEVLKTSETPTAQTSSEKVKAVQRKVDNKYINHVTDKLLPSLD